MNVSDDAGLIELLTLSNSIFQIQAVDTPKITLLLDNGYHFDKVTQALKKVYPSIMTKIRFELSLKSSKEEKVAQGKTGFVPVATR